MKRSTLTYEQFMSEVAKRTEKRENLRGALVFVEKDSWVNLDHYVERFNRDREWVLEVLETPQNDFVIFRFFNKNEDEREGDRYFFIKLYPEDEYISLMIFSFCDYSVFQKMIKSFIHSSHGFWFAWIGSKFLEEFDSYVGRIMSLQSFRIREYNLEFRDIRNRNKKGSTKGWVAARTKDEIQTLRATHHKFNELTYVKRAKFDLKTNGTRWTISLSDRAEFSIRHAKIGDLMTILRGTLAFSRRIRDELKKKMITRELPKKNNEIIQKSIFIEKIEFLDIPVSKPVYSNWFENLTKTFSLGYLTEYRMASFIKEVGNPYFLVEIIDIENKSNVFLSAVGNTIRIAPGGDSETKPSTVSKVLSILQQRVDPSIAIGEDIGKLRQA